MRRKPEVLLDVDGVLADFVSAFLAAVEDATGTAYLPSDVTQWDIGKAIGLSPSAEACVYDRYVRARGFCAGIKPYPGAKDAVTALAEVAEIYACTSPMKRAPFWKDERETWLAEHFGIDAHNVIFVHEKKMVRGAMIVDDKLAHVESWALHNPLGTGVLWKMPFNQTERAAAGERIKATTFWVDSWRAVIDIAKKLK